MPPVTIDRLDIKNHERYAQDQQKLDTKYITDVNTIGNPSEIAGTSTIYASHFETLFELNSKNLHWASFTPPLKYHLQSNRFFSYRILPSIYVSNEFDEEEDTEEEEEEKKNQQKERELITFMKNIHHAKPGTKQNATHFESEKSTIISLLTCIRHLDKILSQINARKRQYQKG